MVVCEPAPPDSTLELFHERAQFKFHRPGTAILMRQMPVRIRDCVGLQQVLVFKMGITPPHAWNINAAVDIYPGDMNPRGPRSRANDCASPRIANFAGPNAIERGPALTPAVAPVNRITPCPRAIIAAATSLAHVNAPKALTRHAASYCSGVISTIVPQTPLPALYSRISGSASFSRIAAKAPATSEKLPTSAGASSTSPPPARISSASVFR